MSLSATLFGRDSAIFKATNILGLGIPGWLDRKFGAPETEGPRLSDLSVQTSTYGTAMPRLYGTIAVAGNITWLENNKLKETVTKNESGGKGGKGSGEPTTTFSYSATFHLSICQGPISGVLRIWCGDKLIYNAGSTDLETVMASNNASERFRIYLGTDDQEPDPRYEAQFGVGNASAHRGEAYIAFYDFELEDYGNSLQGSQFKVEVLKQSDNPLVLVDETSVPQTAIKELLSSFDSSGRSIYIAEDSSNVINAHYAKNGTYGFYASRASDLFGLGALDVFPAVPGFPNQVIRGIQEDPPGKTVFIVGDDEFLLSEPSPSWTLSPDSGIATYGGNLYLFDSSNIYFVVPGPIQQEYELNLPAGIKNIGGGVIGGQPVFFRSTGSPGSAYAYTISESGLSDLFEINNGSSKVFRCALVADGYIYSLENGTITPASGLAISQYALDGSFISRREIALYVTGFDAQAASGVIALYDVNGNRDLKIALGVASQLGTSLASVISSEAVLSSLINESDLDVSLLDDDVKGYKVVGGTIRSALEPLQAAFPFDVRQHGYKIQFLPRGQSSLATIQWDELVPPSEESGEILQESREMDSQLSARTTIKYLDASREYAIAEQYSERLNTEAVNRSERELAIVMTAEQAARTAEVLNFLPWLERTGYGFSLPPSYRYLEPGDVVTIQMPNASYELRLADVNETTAGRIECKGAPNRAALYDSSTSGSEGVPPIGTIPLPGLSLFLPMDIPVVDESIQNFPGFVGVMTGFTDGWPGGMAVRSNDNGQTWTRLQGYTGKATIGLARSSLSASDGTMIDKSGILVDLVSGALESKTKDQMLSGVNYAAYGVGGRWEIVRFQNAALQPDGSYLVSGFVRGDRGTEWTTGLHVGGDYFVLLDDPDNAFIGSPVESLALERLYRGVTLRASVDSATNVPFTYNGVNLECLSPVYASGSRDGSDNFTGSFTRRSRLSSSWWATGVVAPVGEVIEAYEIDVMNGSAVERTIAVSSPLFSYSATDQTTDFGSPQASITFRIYQLSGTVGRGFPYEVTL